MAVWFDYKSIKVTGLVIHSFRTFSRKSGLFNDELGIFANDANEIVVQAVESYDTSSTSHLSPKYSDGTPVARGPSPASPRGRGAFREPLVSARASRARDRPRRVSAVRLGPRT